MCGCSIGPQSYQYHYLSKSRYPAGCMIMGNINLGDNSKLNASQTAFSGTALLLTPSGENHTTEATAQDCCASCAQATDIALVDTATVAENGTIDYIEAQQWFHGCNYFSWYVPQS